ncbi:MAG: invasin domain 3-containing protein, partial [Gemmatimonadales bacterium]
MPVASRLAAGAVVFAVATAVTTCRLQDLVNPGRVNTLKLAPLQLVDSAMAGSTAPRVTAVALTIGGEAVSWSVKTVLGSPWLRPTVTTGAAPDTLSIAMDPTGLAAGVHRDTLVFTTGGVAAAPVLLPVEFRITGCIITDVTPGTQVTDTLTAADCGAPHRANHPARLYRFSANANDSITLRLTSPAFRTYVVLDSGSVPSAAPSLAESGACATGPRDACLVYELLPRTGSYVVEVTSDSAAATGAVTLSITRPRPPASPDTLSQLAADLSTVVPAGGAVAQNTIVFRASLADPDQDSVRLDVEVQPLAVAFSGVPTAASAVVASGSRATVVVNNLSNYTPYHWQARAVDRTGRSSAWVPFGSGAADFRIAIPRPPNLPAALAQLKNNGTTAIAVGATTDQSTVQFQVVVSDSDPADQVRLDVEVQPVGTAFVNAAGASSPLVAGGSVATATIAGLSDNVGYHWQARAVDQTGSAGAWTSFGGNAETAPDFVVAIAPSRLTVLTQPSATTAGEAIAPAVRVAAQDALGNTLASFTGTVSVAIGANPASGTLSGTTAVSAVAGVATFSNLRIDKAGSGYTLLAGAGALAAATTSFAVTPGAISTSQSAVTVSAGTVASGNAVTLMLQAMDAAGNNLTTGGATVVFGASGGTSTGTIGSTTDHGNGTYTATFTGVVAGAATTIGATIGGTAVTSTLPTVTVAPGAISTSQSTVTVSAGTVASGSAVTLTLQAKDAAGNNLTTGGATAVFAVSGGTSTGTIGVTTDHSNGVYTATFTGVTAGTAATIGATIGGTAVTSALPTVTVTVGAISTSQSLVSVSSGTVVSGSAVALTLQAKDAAGNTLTTGGATVAFAASGGTSTGTIGSTTDHGNGTYTATFTGVTAGTATTIGATIGGTAVTSTLPTVTVMPGGISTSQSVVSVSAGTVQSGGAVTLTLQAKDAAGNNLTTGGATVVFTAAGGTSTGTIGSTTDNNNGTYTATFTGVTAGTATTIHATIGGTAVTSALPTVTVTPGGISTTTSTVSVSAGTVASGGTVTLTLQAKDAAGNNLTTGGATVGFTASGGTSTGTIAPSPATDNANGTYTATFTGVTAGTGTTIHATIGGTAVTSTLPTVSVTTGGISTTTSTVSVSSGSVVSGGTVTLTLQAKDATGNNLTTGGATVGFTASGGTSTGTIAPSPATDNANGTYTATFTGVTAGTATTIHATIGGTAVTSTLPTVAVTPGGISTTTSTVSVSAGTVAAGGTVTLTLHAKDAAGNNVAVGGATVAFTASGGTSTGTISPSPATDNANGTYTATFTGVTAGTATTIHATIGGTAVTSTLPTVTVATGTISTATSTVTVSAGTVASGSAVTLTLQAKDAAGNNLTTGGATIAFSATGGTSSGTIAPSPATDNANGTYTATFTGVTAGTATTIDATINTLAVTSALPTVTVTPGLASQLVFTTQPAGTTAGTVFGAAVTARDAQGNTATGFTGAVALAITAGTGKTGASLLGTTSLPAVAGVANFTNLHIDSAGTGYTLTATATGPNSVASGSFNIAAGAAALITKSSGDNLTGPVGTTLGTPHEVRVTDALGNPVSGVSVTWAAATGGGSVSVPLATTDANGHATTVRTLGPTAGMQTTTATATLGGVPTTVTFNITATVGGATQMVLNGGDGQADTVGATLSVPLSVKVADALNNPVSGVSVTWAVTGGGGTVSPPTSTTNTSGIATTSWTLGKSVTPTDSTQSARATAVGSPVNFLATARPGAVNGPQSSVTASPSSIVAGGAAATVTVTARDGFGNVIPNKAVVLSATGTGNTLTQPAGNTNANGVATGTLSSTSAESKTVSATISTLAITQTASVTVTPGAASVATSTVSVSAGTVQSGGTVTLTLQAKDLNGNNLTSGGLAVVFSASGGTSAGTISPSPATDNSNGTYTATFTAVTAGTATTIHATIGGTAVTSTLPTLQVFQVLDHIVVSPATPTLTSIGATQAFTAEAFDVLNVALVSQPTFTW